MGNVRDQVAVVQFIAFRTPLPTRFFYGCIIPVITRDSFTDGELWGGFGFGFGVFSDHELIGIRKVRRTTLSEQQ